MQSSASSSRVLQAVDALNRLDRRTAARLLQEELDTSPAQGERWRSVARLAGTIGEIALETEAMSRYAYSPPTTLGKILDYCKQLSRNGQSDIALSIADSLEPQFQAHPSVLHLQGTIASQRGEFTIAEALFRQTLALTPLAVQTWFALSVIKTFHAGDPDISRMEEARRAVPKSTPDLEAQLLYALGKAYSDAGDKEKASGAYREGAAIMASLNSYDVAQSQAQVAQILRDYTPETLARLSPSDCSSERIIFVNGLPRSGTTLVEQILTSHSAVHDGGEINLLRPAFIPLGDFSISAALTYQASWQGDENAWGALGADYLRMVEGRFGPNGRIIDKTLNQSRLMGLLLHVFPKARVLWLRRRPEDCALSVYRTYFTAPMPWSWSVPNIAAYFQAEDQLYEHWKRLFPERILTVPYENLVASPQEWTEKLMHHCGLRIEAQTLQPYAQKRSVMTASVAQVRRPISASRVGAASADSEFLAAFSNSYYG